MAHDLAEAMLQVAAVQSASLARYAAHESEAGDPTAVLLQDNNVLGGSLIQYERKAASRRNALIRRLDNLSLEARRRNGASN